MWFSISYVCREVNLFEEEWRGYPRKPADIVFPHREEELDLVLFQQLQTIQELDKGRSSRLWDIENVAGVDYNLNMVLDHRLHRFIKCLIEVIFTLLQVVRH